MTKTQKIIVIAMVVLFALAGFFPPQYSGVFDSDGKVVKAVLKWGLNNKIFELFKGRLSVTPQHNNFADIFILEILGILVISTAAFLIAKKDVSGEVTKGKGKLICKKVIILTAALLIILSILFPPNKA